MLPENSLECKERNIKEDRISPIQAGISPDNPFMHRSKNISMLQLFKDGRQFSIEAIAV
jgi:hypothetical protein